MSDAGVAGDERRIRARGQKRSCFPASSHGETARVRIGIWGGRVARLVALFCTQAVFLYPSLFVFAGVLQGLYLCFDRFLRTCKRGNQ